ncbi:hypothetical protein PR202_ga16995 [Eleusine coracana subsp. coracana]|uniref:Ty3 transposon capsid-like protein domain-containing protein n=1 Tax=Eleusine coracana subsp. coracana TaxID=191504 RepID=A0AAV5CP98_ELECO|nr:hypothetical protein PR202_ga16995 [Eleusine coracana subsp. coracana]
MFGHRSSGEDQVQPHRATLPKLSFPKFYGENPRIWVDKYCDYFRIFNIPSYMWTSAASLHMEDNVAKWLQTYKLKHGLGDWNSFVHAVEQKFGAYDYRKAVRELLSLKQVDTVEAYIQSFEAAQFQVSMFNSGYDDMFFTSHFVNGLKDEIRGVVQSQAPDIVERASMIALIQQQILGKSRAKASKSWTPNKSYTPSTVQP